MIKKQPMHVFFIVVDALRQDVVRRMHTQGRLVGGLKFLLDQGFVCENAYANGCPTQISAPSFFTSTLPLDYGGYDRGILDRPVSLPEIFAREGYECIGVATGAWESSMFGYSRGFHRYYHIYDLDNLVIHIINGLYRKYYKDLILQKKYSASNIKQLRRKFILSCIAFLQDEVKFRLGSDYPVSIYPTGYSKETLFKYSKTLAGVKKSILQDKFDLINDDFPKFPKEPENFSVSHKLLMFLVHSLIPQRIIPRSEALTYTSSTTILKYFSDIFTEKSQSSPQFYYMHLLDLHELRFTDSFYQYNFWPFLPRSYKDYHFDVYEAGISYIDRALGQFFTRVLKGKDKDRIAIVLIGDHGHHYGIPCRLSLGQPESHLADIYHESLDSVCILYNPHMKSSSYKKHCSLIDVPPSMLDLVGLSSEPAFQGQSLFRQHQTDVIISETCGSGPCHLPTKPIYLSVKKYPYKMIYREFFLSGERIQKHYELYSLENDRYDIHDLAQDPSFTNVVRQLEKIAVARINNIRHVVKNET